MERARVYKSEVYNQKAQSIGKAMSNKAFRKLISMKKVLALNKDEKFKNQSASVADIVERRRYMLQVN